MESYTAGKRWTRMVSKCAIPQEQSSQWDVFRQESTHTTSDLRMSSAAFRENRLVYKSENLTH